MDAFLGVPYAAAPIDGLRWSPPQGFAPWRDVRLATRFGNRCPQNDTLGVFARPSSTEDCLFLNIFRPNRPEARAKRPVMVWIHGGGLFDGSGDDYDPVNLVTHGDLIVVTFNYRLGALGFLAHPALDQGGGQTVNYGLLDQQFALAWVKRNISRFGGDPDNITIFGESAGGASVLAHLTAPGSAGLFEKAIIQSGGYLPHLPSLAQAEKTGLAFASSAGCVDQSLSCLRRLGVADILRAQTGHEAGLVQDGHVLDRSNLDAFTSGHFRHVPVLIGSNLDEGRWFVAVEKKQYGVPLAASRYDGAVLDAFGPGGAAVLAEYPLSRHVNADVALGAAETDSLFACPGLSIMNALAAYSPVYGYEFADRSAPSYMSPAGFSLGAAHTFELQFLFAGFHGAAGKAQELSRTQRALSRRMIGYWVHFARYGTPGRWPRIAPDLNGMMTFDQDGATVKSGYGERHHCKFWMGRPTPWR